MTGYEVLYKAFFDRIEEDAHFFSYNGVTRDEALEIAKMRTHNYLVEAITLLKLKCTLEIDVQIDEENEEINVDLTSAEVFLISSLMYEIYLSRDISKLRVMMNVLTSSDIKMLSPANERKTFMDMFSTVQNKNLTLIDDYNSRNRITGEKKYIDYEKYDI